MLLLKPDLKARKWLKSDKEKIIRDYVRAARIPFTWDFDKQVDFISKDSIQNIFFIMNYN